MRKIRSSREKKYMKVSVESMISATHVPHHHPGSSCDHGSQRQSGAQRERKEVFLELHCCFENTTLPPQHEYSPVQIIPVLHAVF